ncbi:PhzF family phenazine biosynthesis protein [uncultured Alsobacter sp.]|uniref:PhzF family phenazine biosynthesis protein n=1 Tax=uncultured Alsobacter sp. TaxID=1748258 RepID=UPI0025F3A422|nr:PhzF family phenazine biosynthesis protein [uncultured Alsobacter sp.]
MRRRFFTLDVFTRRPLAGNPLAVVLDAQGLTDTAMQAIAGEFNLSETVFVLPPADPHQRAALRIFTPARELPFAGHPTVGTAVLLGMLDHGHGHGVAGFGLEEKVGLVTCVVEVAGEGHGEATFTLPRLPERLGGAPEARAVAAALGVAETAIGFDRHEPALFSAGVAFTVVPLKTRADVAGVRTDLQRWSPKMGAPGHANAFVYCREPVEDGHHWHARMFAPDMGIGEDPATGAAVAAFAGAIMAFEAPEDGDHLFIVEQGYAMGRPSQIALGLTVDGGVLTRATIGGSAVVVSEGALRL